MSVKFGLVAIQRVGVVCVKSLEPETDPREAGGPTGLNHSNARNSQAVPKN